VSCAGVRGLELTSLSRRWFTISACVGTKRGRKGWFQTWNLPRAGHSSAE